MNPNVMNRMLGSLSKKALSGINTLENLELQRRTVLYESDQNIEHVYFLDDAVGSFYTKRHWRYFEKVCEQHGHIVPQTDADLSKGFAAIARQEAS